MKFAWIQPQCTHGVHRLCQVLGVSASGYYAWRRRKPSKHTLEDARLLGRIEQVHAQTREAYGTVRVWKRLRSLGNRAACIGFNGCASNITS